MKPEIDPFIPIEACNIKYFITFDDQDCSLLRDFDDHESYNAAENFCTTLGDGRAFKTSCDENKLSVHVFADESCSAVQSQELIPFDTCSKYNDPISGGEYHIIVRNEVPVPTGPSETEPQNNDTDNNDN